jgi:hypothetical protein
MRKVKILMKNKFDIIILGLLLGVFLILLSSEVRLIRLERDIKEIRNYFEPPLPELIVPEDH